MEFRNGLLLQLIECIESTQNEVKRKMIETRARNAAPKSSARREREKSSRRIATRLSHAPDCVVSAARRFNQAPG
jgi:hypothetical protein